MRNKKGLSGLSKIGTIILIVVVIAFVLLFINRANILDYFRALPYSDYQEEDEFLDINFTELEGKSAYNNDVEVVIDFDSLNGVSGLLWGRIDRQEGDSDSAWFVEKWGREYVRGDEDRAGNFKIDFNEDGFGVFDFSAGLYKYIGKLDRVWPAKNYNNVRASIRIYDKDGLKETKEIYRSEDGAVTSKGGVVDMYKIISKEYIKAMSGDLFEEDLELKEALQSNQITLIITNGDNDYVFVRWNFENDKAEIVVWPDGKETKEWVIDDENDEFFDSPKVEKDMDEEDIRHVWFLAKSNDPAELSRQVLSVVRFKRAYLESHALSDRYSLSRPYVDNKLYGVEDINAVLNRYGENEE